MAKTLVISGANFTTNKLDTVSFAERIPCTALSLSESTVSMTALSETYTVTATPTPANTTDTVTWTSSNPAVATVANGVITSIGEGSATITATCGDQSATCTVSVVVPIDYVLVAGYNPERRSSVGHAATLGKRTDDPDPLNVLALNSADTTLLPIESKDNIDTGNWYFVPIVLPTGATGIRITSEYELKTRILWFDNTRKETTNNKGAYVLDGKTSSGGYDQTDYAYDITLEVPDIAGVNSFGGCVLTRNRNIANNADHANDITLSFVYT